MRLTEGPDYSGTAMDLPGMDGRGSRLGTLVMPRNVSSTHWNVCGGAEEDVGSGSVNMGKYWLTLPHLLLSHQPPPISM